MALLTTGSPDRVTGGYLFHRRMADAAQRHAANVSFVSIPELPLAWALAAGAWWRRAPALERADVVVLDSIAAAAAAPWLGGIAPPIVGMLHQPPGGMEGFQVGRHVRAAFDRWSYRRLDPLMVASEWLADQLVAAGIDRGRLRVVPPGKDVAAAPATEDDGHADERRAALRRGRAIAALCVANWLPRKGIVELLDAVALLPDDAVTLHLVGDTEADRRYARRVRSRAHAPDLRDRVVVHGIAERHVVAGMYRSVNVFALPSFEEPYGTVWGEAMAAGLPVVGWRAGNLPYLAENGVEALMAAPGDVPALSAALERLARAPGLARSMGAAAARRAEERPTWDDTAATFFSIIEDARAGRRQPTRPSTRTP